MNDHPPERATSVLAAIPRSSRDTCSSFAQVMLGQEVQASPESAKQCKHGCARHGFVLTWSTACRPKLSLRHASKSCSPGPGAWRLQLRQRGVDPTLHAHQQNPSMSECPHTAKGPTA